MTRVEGGRLRGCRPADAAPPSPNRARASQPRRRRGPGSLSSLPADLGGRASPEVMFPVLGVRGLKPQTCNNAVPRARRPRLRFKAAPLTDGIF